VNPEPGGASEHWLAVRVRPGSNREAVLAALFAAGAQGVQELGDELVTLLASGQSADDVSCAVLAASPDATIETEETPRIDWTERWKDSLHVQHLGPLIIAPPWLADGEPPDRTIVIEPAMAFGTGEHPTTRGIVRLLPGVVRKDDRVVDLGAGSAVLSIAAVKLGAAHAFAIEIDADAIGNAEENIARNGVSDRVTVLHGDANALLPLVAPVDLALANIISSAIKELLPAIESALATGGHAIISGILREELPEMLEVLTAGGWRVEQQDVEDIWWSAVITRPMTEARSGTRAHAA
jgi:ribosomal protein L11 methyltransferase